MKGRRKYFNDLVAEMNLGNKFKDLSSDDVKAVMKYFRYSDDEVLITERYFNSKTIAEIIEEYPNFSFTTSNAEIYIHPRVTKLANIIKLFYGPRGDITLGVFFESDFLKCVRLNKSHPHSNMAVSNFKRILYETEYMPSKQIDYMVDILQYFGYLLDFPEIMKKHPKYPYNLYLEYACVRTHNETVKDRMDVILALGKFIPEYTPEYFTRNFNWIDKRLRKELIGPEIILYESYYIHGLNLEEISRINKIPIMSVKNIRKRVVRKLQGIMLEVHKIRRDKEEERVI